MYYLNSSLHFLFIAIIFLNVTVIISTGDNQRSPSDVCFNEDCSRHTSQWSSINHQPTKSLTALIECPCNHLQSLQPLLTNLRNFLTTVFKTTKVDVILYTEKDKTTNYKWPSTDVRNNNGCGLLCQGTTPTDSSSMETLLEVTIDVLESNKKWVESSLMNELHIIGISSRNDTSHVTDHVTKEQYHPLITSLLNYSVISQTTLHYIINRVGIMSLLGDPLQVVTYSDHTHYNKALTLSNLIASDQSDTVQAHCLAAGLNLMISDYTTSLDAIHYSAILWDPYPLNVQYQNYCTVSNECSYYCSPLHGCVSHNEEDVSVNSTDKPLLSSVEFKTSHAEYKSLWNVMEGKEPADSKNKESILSILRPSFSESPFVYNDVVRGVPKKVKWTSYDDLIAYGQPVLLTSTELDNWPALKLWSMSYLSNHITDTSYVKCSDNYLTFDPDSKAPLKLDLSLPYKVKNMSSDLFFDCVQDQRNCNDDYKGHYYFGEIPSSLKPDLKPNAFLYNTQEDFDKERQYIWISSTGMITHGHFDQDYNLFIQLVGTKRFTLWSPSQHELLYTYPRVHPLWHKSRLNFRDVDLSLFPYFSRSSALQVTVRPGDILYIPPYTWHYVETLSPSVSLSTWSHDYHMYSHMNAVYGHDHKFDLIGSTKGQMFSLRLYLDMLIQDLYGFNETSQYFAKLLALRFTGLENLFPPKEDDSLICEYDKTRPGKIPTCFHVHGFVKLDVQVVGAHFKSLRPEVMDILFGDYIEEITAQVVGVHKMLAFFRYCFQGQSYYITNEGDKEHSLWDSPKL